MVSCKWNWILPASLLVVVALVAGCGGGGGTPPPAPGSGFDVTGTVVVGGANGNTPVSGVVVTMLGITGTTNAQGKFSIHLLSNPSPTLSLDLSTAVPAVDTRSVQYKSVSYSPSAVTLPATIVSGGDIGTIVASALDSPPPPPF